MTTNQQLYGMDTPLPTCQELRTGPLTVGYENGFFRYFRWGEHEILRMVYVALRDEHWGTLVPIRSEEVIRVENDRFRISYTSHYEREGTALFSWVITAEGSVSGQFTMTIDGTAHQRFLKNRVGFCILHPIQGTAGQPCELLPTTGQWETTHFPERISPENPFKQLAAMRWQHASGAWFRLDMTGDVFETEDQRNWTDASFKTFSTPSELPIPVVVQPGDRVQQRILFRPDESLPFLPVPVQKEMAVRVLEQERTRLPMIGIGASTETGMLSVEMRLSLQRCSFSHYRVEVYPAQHNWQERFLADVKTAQDLKTPLLVALHLSVNHVAELQTFLDVVQQNAVAVAELLFVSADAPTPAAKLLARVLDSVRKRLPLLRIGAGTDSHFTELNRNRIPTDNLDFISYAIHPQVHAVDHRSMIETLQTQAETVQTARTFVGSAPVYVSPVTLRERTAPDMPNPSGGESRQVSLWAAGWTLGSVKYLAEARAETVTYYQAVGQQGLMTAEGQWYPCGLVLAIIQEFRAGLVIRTETDNPLSCTTLLLTTTNRRCWLMANHTDQPIIIQLPETIRTGYRITAFPAQKEALNLPSAQPFTVEPFGTWVLEV